MKCVVAVVAVVAVVVLMLLLLLLLLLFRARYILPIPTAVQQQVQQSTQLPGNYMAIPLGDNHGA